MWTVQSRFLRFTVFIGMVGLSCTNDRGPVEPVKETVQVSGTIRSWICRNGFYPQPSQDRLYVRDWQGSATVTFIDSLGQIDSCHADDSSAYQIELAPGRYDLVLATDHNFPETLFAVAIEKDTSVDWDIDIRWYYGDSLYFRIMYVPASDSLGVKAEMAYLMFLNDRIGSMLEIDSAVRYFFWSEYDPEVISTGFDLVIRPGFRIWQVYEASWIVFEEYESFFPEYTSLGAHHFACLY